LDSALRFQRKMIREKSGRVELTRVLTAATAAAAITAPGTAAAAGPLFAGTGFIDGEIPALDVLAVDLRNRSLRAFRGGHRDEGEAAGAVGGAIHYQVDFRDGAAGRKKVLQVVFGGVKGEVPDV